MSPPPRVPPPPPTQASGLMDITLTLSPNDNNSKSDRKCFRCEDPNHLIGECPKPPKGKNQRALVGGSWGDSGEEDDEKAKDETCLMAQASSEISLGVDLEPDKWIKDIRCSKYMTGNRKLISTYKAYYGGNVIFGSNLRGNIISKGQICDNKCRVTFSEQDSEITKDGKTSSLVDDDLDEEEAIKVTEKKNLENDIEDETLEIDDVVNIKESRNHPLENVIGNLTQRTLRSQAQN
ncbi:zf-CCHC domain-containing protein [Tanacetum coccineum]